MVDHCYPDACTLCGNHQTEVKRFVLYQSVDRKGGVHVGGLCDECVRVFMAALAKEDRAAFEALVDEARAFADGTGQG